VLVSGTIFAVSCDVHIPVESTVIDVTVSATDIVVPATSVALGTLVASIVPKLSLIVKLLACELAAIVIVTTTFLAIVMSFFYYIMIFY
jgi:hypothetical protein